MPQGVHNRSNLYRNVFLAAGCYNIAWGLFSVFYPQWFFDLTALPQLNHPAIFACLGMTIGLYGILYLHVANSLDNGTLIILVGLIGKILGPIGLIYLLVTGIWPFSSVVLILTNDLIWLPFFALYLKDYWFKISNIERQ